MIKIVFSTALTTLLAVFLGSMAQAQTDLGSYYVQKSQNYVQSSTSTPTTDPYRPYSLYAGVTGNNGASIVDSQLTSPSGGTGVFDFGSNGLNFSKDYISQSALDTAFPSGTYNFAIRTSTPNVYFQSQSLGTDNFPTLIPQITSTSPSGTWNQGVLQITVSNNSQQITFNWPAFTGTGSINLTINGTTTTFPADGAHTSYTLPGNTLQTGQVYQCELQYENAGFQNSTSFFVMPIVSPTSPPASTNPNSVSKVHVVKQTSNSAPADSNGRSGDNYGPYSFVAQCSTGGTFTAPNGTHNETPTTRGNSSGYLFCSGPFSSQANLDSAYPDGSYTLPNGAVVNLTGFTVSNVYSDVYPNITQITAVNGTTPVWNADGELVLDPTVANTLTWTPFTTTNPSFTYTTGGFIFASFGSDAGNFNQISVSANGPSSKPAVNTLTIPANTMTAGSTYRGNIEYYLASSYVTNSGVSNGAAFATETNFKAVAEPATYNFELQANAPQGSGWIVSPWLGSVNISNSTFHYTSFFGFIAPFASDAGSVFYYDSQWNDFIFTSEYDYPYFYGFKNNKWYYLYTGSAPSSPAYASIYEFNGRGWIFANQY